MKEILLAIGMTLLFMTGASIMGEKMDSIQNITLYFVLLHWNKSILAKNTYNRTLANPIAEINDNEGFMFLKIIIQ